MIKENILDKEVIKISILRDKKYLDEIAQKEKEIFQSTAFDKKIMDEIFDNKRCSIIVAKNCDKICGHAIVFDAIDANELLKIAVNNDERKKGIGTKILYFITELNNNPIFLEVRETNIAAQDFYKKFGFIKISERKRYYSDTGENAYIMVYKK